MRGKHKPRLSKREEFVRMQIDIAEDFSEGAFWGFMQENGIEADEVVAVSEKCYSAVECEGGNER